MTRHQPLLVTSFFALLAGLPAAANGGDGLARHVRHASPLREGCQIVASKAQLPPQGDDGLVHGRAAGILNGMNSSLPANDVIRPLGLSMWRGPIASWLWPNRTSCRGVGTCCTPDSCLPPFSEVERIANFGLRQQFILSGILTGQGGCEWQSFRSNPHNCSLPGGPTDTDYAQWKSTVVSAANEAKRRGLSDAYFDVWNEPNAQHKVQCMGNFTPPCVFDANLTQMAFFAIWDEAHRTLRATMPSAKVVGPSLADGGPGIFGFERSVFPWLQAFLRHTAAAGTLPDVLTWHVSTLHQNSSLLYRHHALLRQWGAGAGIKLPAIGHNEIVGPAGAVSPASNFGVLSVLEKLRAEHSVKACYPDPVTGQSPCWDNSLDGLLVDDCPKSSAPLKPSCDTLAKRPVYFAYLWYAESKGQRLEAFSASDGCGSAGSMVGQSTSSPPTVPLQAAHQPLASVIFGQWTDRHTSGYRTNLSASVTVDGRLLPPQLAGKLLRVRVERLTASADLRAAVEKGGLVATEHKVQSGKKDGTVELRIDGFDSDGLIRVSVLPPLSA
eukprot:COSAG01_NODE_1829_length_9125_cov_11.706182_3_plen_554_part_00